MFAVNVERLDYRAMERKPGAYLADFEEIPVEKLGPYQHAGKELLHVIQGSLILRIRSKHFQLDAKDAIHF